MRGGKKIKKIKDLIADIGRFLSLFIFDQIFLSFSHLLAADAVSRFFFRNVWVQASALPNASLQEANCILAIASLFVRAYHSSSSSKKHFMINL